MRVRIREHDPIRPDDDVVIRAGGGSVQALVDRARLNAPDYQDLYDRGVIRSTYTISVNVPVKASPPWRSCSSSPRTSTTGLTSTSTPGTCWPWGIWTSRLPRRVPVAGETLTPADLCHYDVVVQAHDEQQLTARIAEIRGLFRRHTNPAHRP